MTTLLEKHKARERALQLSRDTVRFSANAIRAIHRQEFQQARELLSQVTRYLRETEEVLEGHRDIYYAGFVEDAQKEYVEALATLAFSEGSALPMPEQLGVSVAAYLNGLGEAVGELRRYILDSLRRGDSSRCEELLEVMDEVYTLLITMDFPEAITRGLRRTCDAMRGVLERTRGDLTMALQQRSLEQRLGAYEEYLMVEERPLVDEP
ncbi:MAG: haloacid dehalogenase [Chloroflexi bacterium]|nr:haloacid dehalogenase [Chloroflexota bacterium]